MLIQHELEVSWMKVIKGSSTSTVADGKRAGSEFRIRLALSYWSFDVGSSGSTNPPLSVSNKAFTRNRVANILPCTWNHCSNYASLDLHNPNGTRIKPRFGFSPLKTTTTTCVRSSGWFFFGLFSYWDLLYPFVLTYFENQPALLRLFTPFLSSWLCKVW